MKTNAIGESLGWIPVKQEFKQGDTMFDKLYNYKFIMPDIRYGMVGVRNEHGSVEGEYVSNSGKLKYQSILRISRMILTEKVIQFEKLDFIRSLG